MRYFVIKSREMENINHLMMDYDPEYVYTDNFQVLVSYIQRLKDRMGNVNLDDYITVIEIYTENIHEFMAKEYGISSSDNDELKFILSIDCAIGIPISRNQFQLYDTYDNHSISVMDAFTQSMTVLLTLTPYIKLSDDILYNLIINNLKVRLYRLIYNVRTGKYFDNDIDMIKLMSIMGYDDDLSIPF